MSSPNRSSISLSNAISAFSSSLPRTINSTDDPLAAASIIKPMMLFPLTLFSPELISISDSNADAVSTKRAAARACKPNLLTITTVFFCNPGQPVSSP